MTMPWLKMTPVPSTVPLPAVNQPDRVAVGMNTPVLPIIELAPTSDAPSSTPAVTSVVLGDATSANDLT